MVYIKGRCEILVVHDAVSFGLVCRPCVPQATLKSVVRLFGLWRAKQTISKVVIKSVVLEIGVLPAYNLIILVAGNDAVCHILVVQRQADIAIKVGKIQGVAIASRKHVEAAYRAMHQ